MSPSSTGRKILLVDDSAPLRRAVSRLLRHAGFEVVATEGADAAVAAASSESFDLAMVDLEMPEADGWATIDRLAAVDARLGAWAILFTGVHLDEELVARAAERGIPILPKGSDTETILRAIRERIAARG